MLSPQATSLYSDDDGSRIDYFCVSIIILAGEEGFFSDFAAEVDFLLLFAAFLSVLKTGIYGASGDYTLMGLLLSLRFFFQQFW